MDDFNDLYIKLRSKEKRIYSDAEVANLPDISTSHIHYKEWKVRAESCSRLLRYLSKKKKPLNILEVGCGNGWLSAQMASIKETKVKGIDTNIIELQQAKKVFAEKKNVSYANALIEEEIRSGNKYDIIVFAASIQYFASLKNVLLQALNLLNQDGEIHILDTHFYNESERILAKERTANYFEKMEFKEIAPYYHHHLLSELRVFDFKILYNPDNIINKILLRKNPFYWIRIKKN